MSDFKIELSSLLQNPKIQSKFNQLKPELAPLADTLKKRFASKELGFYDLPQTALETLEKQKALAAQIKNDFAGAIIFGIGGSYLGPAAVYEALTPDFPLYWLSNTDPGEMLRLSDIISEHKLASVVISKSGNTVETLSSFFHFSKQLNPSGYVLITDPASGTLRRLATENRWTSLEVPPNVGGRFSVLSPVGIFPTLLAGLNAEALLKGAAEFKNQLDRLPDSENPAYQFALLSFLWDTEMNHSLQYLMPYQRNLKLLSEWYVQLWGESLGKKGKGPTAISALGTTDQHSLLQLFKEGPRNKVVGFLNVKEDVYDSEVGKPSFAVPEFDYLWKHSFQSISEKASHATEKSLQNSGVPTYRIDISKIDERTLGALFFFFETACAFAGELYQINAFDQPGVEETKKLLRAAL